MKGEGFIPNKDFGRGTIGPSLLDYERAGMPQFKSPDRNPFKWGKEVLKRASQSILLAPTLNGSLPTNAAVPLPDVPAGINHVRNILELPRLIAEKFSSLHPSLLPCDTTATSPPQN